MHSHILSSDTKRCHPAHLDCASFCQFIWRSLSHHLKRYTTSSAAPPVLLPNSHPLVWPRSRLPRSHCLYVWCIAFHSYASPAKISGLFPTLRPTCLPGQLLCPHRSSFAGVPAGPAGNRSPRAVDPLAFPVVATFSPFVGCTCKSVVTRRLYRCRPGTDVTRTASLAPQFETCRCCTWNCLLFV